MNTCKCGRVTYRAGTRCMSCAKTTAWAAGDYGDQRDRLRTLRTLSGGRVERVSTPLCNRDPAQPHSAVDNALRDAFRQVFGFDPLYDKNPAWKFPKRINDEASDAP